MKGKTLYLNNVPIGSATTWQEVAEILSQRFGRLVTVRQAQRYGSEGPDGFYVTTQR